MTTEKLLSLLQNVPKNATLLSDSGWECGPTDMDGIYYNKEKNEIIFTQGGWYDISYHLEEKCLYCSALDDSSEDEKDRIKQDLKEIRNCYLDESRIIRSCLENLEGF